MIPELLKNTVAAGTRVSWMGLLGWGQEQLAVLGPQEAQASASYLLEEVSGLKPWQMGLPGNEPPNASAVEKYGAWIDKRRQRAPTAYVVGKAFFREEVLVVGPECLVPRPETELLVEAVIQSLAGEASKKFDFLDLGTGSGAIAISLLRFFPKASAVMVDISPAALKVADHNAKRYGLAGRYQSIGSDFFSAFKQEKPKRTWPIIVSNPPYLAAADWQKTEPELFAEPRLALDGGEDGLDAYRVIAREAGDYLEAQGRLFLEVGQGQSGEVYRLLAEQNFIDLCILKDFAGIERIVTAKKGLHG